MNQNISPVLEGGHVETTKGEGRGTCEVELHNKNRYVGRGLGAYSEVGLHNENYHWQ